MQISINKADRIRIDIQDEMVNISIESKPIKSKKRPRIEDIAQSIPDIKPLERAPVTLEEFEQMLEDMREKDEY